MAWSVEEMRQEERQYSPFTPCCLRDGTTFPDSPRVAAELRLCSGFRQVISQLLHALLFWGRVVVPQGRGNWSPDIVLGCSPALDEIRRPGRPGRPGEVGGMKEGRKVGKRKHRLPSPTLIPGFVLRAQAVRRNMLCREVPLIRAKVRFDSLVIVWRRGDPDVWHDATGLLDTV